LKKFGTDDTLLPSKAQLIALNVWWDLLGFIQNGEAKVLGSLHPHVVMKMMDHGLRVTSRAANVLSINFIKYLFFPLINSDSL
jgi:hypothetical protein